MLSVQWSQESEFKRRASNLLEQKLEEICGKSLLWWYSVVSSTKFRVSHHQDDWITEQCALWISSLRCTKRTRNCRTSICTQSSLTAIWTVAVSNTVPEFGLQKPKAHPKRLTLYSALSSDEMSDTAFIKGIARLIPQIVELQPPA